MRRIDVHGRAVAYTDVGSGPALVLVHTGTWSFVWRDLIALLAPSFRVIALDAPGTGLSDPVPRTDIDAAADALDSLVRELRLDDLVLVLHDLGGPVGLEAASRWPGRVSGLVAVNSFSWRPRGVVFGAMLRVMGSAPVRELDAWSGLIPAATSTRLGVGRHWATDVRCTFRRGVDARSFHRYMRAARRHDYSSIELVTAELADRPLLTVFGERNDPLHFRPQWAERFARTSEIVIPKGNHFPMCDAPHAVAARISEWHRQEIRRPGSAAEPGG